MSSLLSTAESPFVIVNNGKEYSFIDDLNPSGGNTSKTESTGVITRFTINNNNDAMRNLASLYKNQNKYELSEKYYKESIADGSETALNDLAVLYHEQKYGI